MSANQYFERYSEPEIQSLTGFPERNYRQVICIPAYKESPAFLERLLQVDAVQQDQVLLVLVVNRPDNAVNDSTNRPLLQFLQQAEQHWQQQHLNLIRLDKLEILLVDRDQLPIPSKQGVGLARKIACDIACWLITAGHIDTDQVFCSDADVHFPADYFSTRLPDAASAGVFRFTHTASGNSEIDTATQVYETSLQHYVDGLHYAGSRYAYHTIGSCLLIRAEHYIQARGFPKRAGGEDFYLLNKLNKLEEVITLEQTLDIESRRSDRVPFGTGPAVEQLLTGSPYTAAIFYHPDCFEILKAWLVFLQEAATLGTPELVYEQNALIQALAEDCGFYDQAKKIFQNYSKAEHRIRAIHHWFDGFRTLKCIHFLRDHHAASISLNQLQQLPALV